MLLKRELPPADVMPGPELISHGAIDPDRLKSEGLMQSHTRLIRHRDTGIGLIEALQGQERKERALQRLTHAQAPGVFMHVD